ncbi:MAG: ABC transporter ATP-binding protein [Pseudomonadota bacterium]
MSDPVLEISGLTKSYKRGAAGDVDVLRGVDLQITAGEVVALVAPSGAGKSTLLHCAGLLDTADSGHIRVAGADTDGLKDGSRTVIRRQDIGFVYQFHHLLPEFSALENIVLPQLANGTPKARAENRGIDLLTSVGLADRSGHRPAALSGGEQQRVAYCRALANTPRLLLADEPTGNLDPATSDQVFEALMGLVRKTGMAALIATHNHALAMRMDRQVRLQAGRIVEGLNLNQ